MGGHILSYSIVASCTLAILYIVYRLFMAGAKQPRFNRMMLLGICVLSFIVVPVAGSFYVADSVVDPFAPVEEDQIVYTPRQGRVFVKKGERTRFTPVEVVVMAGRDQRMFKFLKSCVKLYMVGVAAVLLMFVVSLARLALMIRRGERRRIGDAILVIVDSDKSMSPFCFGRYVVMKRSVADSEYATMILEHELTHVRSLHWVDLVAGYFGAALCWYNPFAWMLLKAMKEVHEYEVDASMIDHGTTAREYQLMLINRVGGTRLQPFADNLNNSKLKKRIVMMQKDSSSKKRMGLGILAVLSGVTFALFFIQTPSMAEMITEFDQSGLQRLPKSKYRLEAEKETREHNNLGNIIDYDVFFPETADMDEVVGQILEDASETEVDENVTEEPTENNESKSAAASDEVTYFYVDGKLMGQGTESIKNINPSDIGSMTVDKSHGDTRIYIELKKGDEAVKADLHLTIVEFRKGNGDAEVKVAIDGAQSLTVSQCRLINDGKSYSSGSMNMQGTDGKQVLTAKFTGIKEFKDPAIEVVTDKGTLVKFLMQ